MEDGVEEDFGFFRGARSDLGLAEGDAASAGAEDFVGAAVDVEAEEFAVLGVGAEDGGDGVVGGDLGEADAHGGDEAAVDFGAVGLGGDVAFGLGEPVEKGGFEIGGGFGEELVGELEDAAGVGEDLDGFDAGDVVEEPAAGGVHEEGVALEFEELPDRHAIGGGEGAEGVLGEEAFAGGGGGVEEDADVEVAGCPEVSE